MNPKSVAQGLVSRELVRKALKALGAEASNAAIAEHAGLSRRAVMRHRLDLGQPSILPRGRQPGQRSKSRLLVVPRAPTSPVKSPPKLIEHVASAAFVLVDRRGKVLVQLKTFEDAMASGRRTPGAICVVGAPSGVVLARIAHGAESPSDVDATRAAQRWLRGAA